MKQSHFLLKIYVAFAVSFSFIDHALAKFDFFAEHPFANEIGISNDQIEDLMFYQGSIYAGYGTHANHSFATRICGFTPPNRTFECPEVFDSEGAGHFRNIDNKLYIAGIDPRPPASHFYIRKSGEDWFAQPAFTTNVAHIYDIESSGGNLWVTLTKFDDDSRVMKGNDNGVWEESLFVTPESGHTTQNYSVLYFVAEYQGVLYTQAFDTLDGIRPYSFMSSDNGDTWPQGPNILLHVPPTPNSSGGVLNFRHEIFAGKLVMKQSRFLTTFDGIDAETIRSNVRNFTVTDDVLYVLDESGSIFSTVDLVNWVFVAESVNNASSIEVLGDDIFVGTEDANIYWSEGILTPPSPSANAFLISILFMILDLFPPEQVSE